MFLCYALFVDYLNDASGNLGSGSYGEEHFRFFSSGKSLAQFHFSHLVNHSAKMSCSLLTYHSAASARNTFLRIRLVWFCLGYGSSRTLSGAGKTSLAFKRPMGDTAICGTRPAYDGTPTMSKSPSLDSVTSSPTVPSVMSYSFTSTPSNESAIARIIRRVVNVAL